MRFVARDNTPKYEVHIEEHERGVFVYVNNISIVRFDDKTLYIDEVVCSNLGLTIERKW